MRVAPVPVVCLAKSTGLSLLAALASALRRAGLPATAASLRADCAREAEAFSSGGDVRKAEAILEGVVKGQSECSPCWTLLGLACLGSGRWQSAGREFRAAAESRNPRRPRPETPRAAGGPRDS